MSIFSEYNEFKYLYPPRPEAAVAPHLLATFGSGWIAQPKYNGSCSVLFINGRKEHRLYNRNGEELSLQKPINYVELNDSDRYMVLCGEYLNKNKKGEDGHPFNHVFIIWDILVWQGRYLIGQTFEDRLNILYKLFGSNRGTVTSNGIQLFNHLFTTNIDNVFLATSYLSGFKPLYDEVVQTDLYEGLVMKKATAKLELGYKEKNNSGWQLKARKQTKNYQF